ncbi:hypothetical protein [Kineosporia sp. NBRC 101731]|uniref:hypothetical protein n=1 Tax=Kineosporia sp. NBRC 101731 TaxID=3032199 RepID=UPI0024A44ECF|nr:hypothetical protein [Kineosporia sp. NBRC 101731]GLY32498.1 hypothetical protein Kisp02_58630 [Kineosporia sp. NBRC 101731]
MTYEQLSQHVADIQQSALVFALRSQEVTYDEKTKTYHDYISDIQVDPPTRETTGQFEVVAELFEPFYRMPDPAELRVLRGWVASAAAKLNHDGAEISVDSGFVGSNPQLGKMDAIASLISDWDGFAAMEFHENFLGHWPHVTANQFSIALALVGMVEAEAALWEQARLDVCDIAHAAQTAMDAVGDCRAEDVQFTLNVFSSIFSLSTLVVPQAEMALTLVGEVAAVAGATPVGDKKEGKFTGQSPEEIIDEIRASLDELTRRINASEDKVRESADYALGILATHQDKFTSPRPALADGTRANIKDDNDGFGRPIG